MRTRRLVPWLLTLGLVVTVFAWTWQHAEERLRGEPGALRLPAGMAMEPWDTLEARIRATWEPGDRMRLVPLVAGAMLLLAGVWRAWRSEGLPVAAVRRVWIHLALVGAASLLLGFVRWRTHPPELTCDAYIVPGGGYMQALGSPAPVELRTLAEAGLLLLGLALLIGIAARLRAPRTPRSSTEPASTP